MEPRKGNSTLRKVRTFADDVRRAQNGAPQSDTVTVTQATSIVAPTITARISAATPTQLETEVAKKGFLSGVLDTSLLDIRNVEQGIGEATIISERKTKQWSFIDAVSTSFQSWWKELMADITPKEQEIPRVAPSGKRNAIVRAASMDAKMAPRDDTAAFTPRAPVVPVVPTPEPQVEKSPVWGSAPQVASVQTTRLNDADIVPKIIRPSIRPPSVTAQRIEPAPRPTPVFREYSSAPIAAKETTTPTPPEPIALPTTVVDTPAKPDDSIRLREEAIRAESTRFAEKAREAALRRKAYEAESNGESSFSKFFVYGALTLVGICVVIAIGGVGYALFNARNTTTAVAPPPGIRMLFDVSESVAVPLLNNRTDFLVDLTKRVQSASGPSGSFLRYYFVYENDSKEKELPAQAFLDILDLRAPGSFLRTIEEQMMFGAYRGETRAPFLVFKVKNFEDALGGMLLFEQNMNSDLAPLFGENLERIGQKGIYRDEVIGGVDTRSLYDESGNMVITYAFIDKRTLVITTSYTALGALAQVLK